MMIHQPEWRMIEQDRIFELPGGRHEVYSVAGITDPASGITITREGRSREGTWHFLVHTPLESFRMYADRVVDTEHHTLVYQVHALDNVPWNNTPQIKQHVTMIVASLGRFLQLSADPEHKVWRIRVELLVGSLLSTRIAREEDLL